MSIFTSRDVAYTAGIYDGYIQPLGMQFKDGFQIVVSRTSSATRARFTIAHEICHTFFYEYVPEIKFAPHPTNEEEERLCNLGAADLLMPAKDIRRAARQLPVCLESLESLAAHYVVSRSAMLLRLRALRLWQAELSFWIRMADGRFAPRRMIGGRALNWRWLDDSIPLRTWETGRRGGGHTFLDYVNETGTRIVRPIRYDMARGKDCIIVLWGTDLDTSGKSERTLFSSLPICTTLPN